VAALVTEQGYASDGSDANLRRAAQASVPIIQHHLEMARALQASLPAK
jgi:predicted outer membrane protein